MILKGKFAKEDAFQIRHNFFPSSMKVNYKVKKFQAKQE